MPIQLINLGTYANSGTGDDLRTAFEKVNTNFQFLDDTSAVTAENIGAGAQIFKEKSGDNLRLRSIVAGTGMTVTQNANDVTVASVIDITRDTVPVLGGNLQLGGFNITGTGNINITGGSTFSGDVEINGGDLISSVNTFNLLNTTVTNVNFGGQADNINIGKNTGIVTVASEFRVNEDIVIGNNGRLKTTNSSGYVYNEAANYVFMGQTAIRIDIGSPSGEVVLGNDLEVPGDVQVIGNTALTGTLTLGSVANLVIPGGLNGYVLSTNGSGSLNWIPAPSGGGGSGGLDFGSFASPAGFTLDLGSFV